MLSLDFQLEDFKIKEFAKSGVKALAKIGIRFIQESPRVRAILSLILNRFPKIKAKILTFLKRRNFFNISRVEIRPENEMSSEVSRIYHRLKREIRNNKKKGVS